MRLSRTINGDGQYCCNCTNKALYNLETITGKIAFCNECLVEFIRIVSHIEVPLVGGVLVRAKD